PSGLMTSAVVECPRGYSPTHWSRIDTATVNHVYGGPRVTERATCGQAYRGQLPIVVIFIRPTITVSQNDGHNGYELQRRAGDSLTDRGVPIGDLIKSGLNRNVGLAQLDDLGRTVRGGVAHSLRIGNGMRACAPCVIGCTRAAPKRQILS